MQYHCWRSLAPTKTWRSVWRINIPWRDLCTRRANRRISNHLRHYFQSTMDTYLYRTSNKLLIHGIQLQLTPLDPGSFRSRHTLRNQKSLRHFKRLQLLTWIHTSWKL
jgi:hypothetical protein